MMKILITILTIVVLAGCNTPYYITANNMSGQPASITLNTGVELQGKISVHSFDNYSSIDHIQFSKSATNQYENYYLENIQSVFLNGSTYCVKRLIGSTFWNGSALRLVKQLTKAGGRMDLFQLEVVVKNVTTNKIDNSIEYYLQLPNAVYGEIYNVESGKFTPNFDTKMSSYVQDCPALAAKIKSKDKAYFYPFVVNFGELRRKSVLLQIINDYNNCTN